MTTLINSKEKLSKAIEERQKRIDAYARSLLKKDPGISQKEFDRKMEEYAEAPHYPKKDDPFSTKK